MIRSGRFPFHLPALDSWQAVESQDFPAAAEHLALRIRAFYNSRAHWHRRFYRLSAIIVITAGGALPLLSSFDYPGKDVMVSLAGFIVAVVTALRALYRWDYSWILLRNTEMRITREYLSWKGSPETLATDVNGRREAARNLLSNILEIRKDEAESFFADLPFPESRRT